MRRGPIAAAQNGAAFSPDVSGWETGAGTGVQKMGKRLSCRSECSSLFCMQARQICVAAAS